MPSAYPIKKYDHRNRLQYVDWNGVERVINVYWGETDRVKIKYRLYNKDVEIEAYDISGNVILKSSSGVLEARLTRLMIKDGRIMYGVEPSKISEWRGKLEKRRRLRPLT